MLYHRSSFMLYIKPYTQTRVCIQSKKENVSLYCLLLDMTYEIKTPQKSQINLTATTYITYKIEKGGRGTN